MDVWFTDGWANRRPRPWLFDRMEDFVNGQFSGFTSDHEVPPVDVVEDENGYRFYFEMPGMKADSMAARIEDGLLIVEAERQRPEYPKDATLHRSERHYGKFHRAFRLPEKLAGEQVTASYKAGVLEVTVAKPAQARPVKIEINHN